jgi:hypothetical protein
VARGWGQGRLLWMICVALAIFGALLGLRSERAVSSVLAGPGFDILAAGTQSGGIPDLDRLAVKDSLLAAAEPSARDSFSDPPPPPRPARKATPSKPKTVVVPQPPQPHLQALLYDHVDPAVQLRVGGKTSEWLSVGADHGGWKILEITSGSVVVTHSQGDTLTLF